MLLSKVLRSKHQLHSMFGGLAIEAVGQRWQPMTALGKLLSQLQELQAAMIICFGEATRAQARPLLAARLPDNKC